MHISYQIQLENLKRIEVNTIRIYSDDLKIARSLIRHDESVTRNFFYIQCFPLFKSIYDNYYTDCVAVKEFVDEMYLLVLAPSSKTGKCQMENYRGESTLTSWLKAVCLFYCYKRFEKRKRMPIYESLQNSIEKRDEDNRCGDRINDIYGSLEIDCSNLNYQDTLVILSQMPNKRYRDIIRMRYLEQKTNEETAEALGMTMDNYYNKHKLAKEQYMRIFRKEVLHG